MGFTWTELPGARRFLDLLRSCKFFSETRVLDMHINEQALAPASDSDWQLPQATTLNLPDLIIYYVTVSNAIQGQSNCRMQPYSCS